MKVPLGPVNQGIVLVELDGEPINVLQEAKAHGSNPRYGDVWLIDKEITTQKACVFNLKNQTYSDNSVYINKRGAYIKKGGRRYFIKDFK